MKHTTARFSALAAITLLPLALTQCVISESDLENAVAESNAEYGRSLTAVRGKGKVAIMDSGRTVATCYTASPNIEQTRWHKGQQQITVKSRGNHGPATVQLFNSRTGGLEGSVMAYELANGGPKWAAGMAD